MKSFIQKSGLLAAVAVLLGLGSFRGAQAVTVTNRGEVIEVQTAEETALEARDNSVIQDTSIYPAAAGQSGTIVRWFDFANQGGTNTGSILLDPPVEIPSNTIIRGGYIQVVTPVLPATSTNSIGVNSLVDILAAGTTLGSTGIKATVPVGTAATAIVVTNNLLVKAGITGSPATSGVYRLVLDVSKGQ